MNVRGRTVLGLVAIAGLGFGLTSAVVAGGAKGEKKGSNIQEAPKGVKASAKTRDIQALELADQLIRYGRQEKNAESLLLAAQILHKTRTRPLDAGHSVTGKGDKVSTPAKAKNSPKALLAEAKKLSSSDQVETLAKATEKMLQEDIRGASPGPRIDAFAVGPYQTINWNPITFRANERAEVYINTGVFSTMVLEIIDENGIVVVRDSIPANFYRCVWYPRWTGPFRIRLTSNDNISFNCRLATN